MSLEDDIFTDDYKDELAFFKKLEVDIPTKIPILLKCVLTVCELNDELTISKLTGEQIKEMKVFIDSDRGKRHLQELIGASTKRKVKEFLEQPSILFEIPGTSVRLTGMIEFCQSRQQSQRDKEQKGIRVEQKSKHSSSPAPKPAPEPSSETANNNFDKDVPVILQTVKRLVDKTNVPSSERSLLETPKITIFRAGSTINAHLVCSACPEAPTKENRSTIYKKGYSSWNIWNYSNIWKDFMSSSSQVIQVQWNNICSKTSLRIQVLQLW